jgi:large subunit ribosomal protein L18
MDKNKQNLQDRRLRADRVRKTLRGDSDRPRLSVFRSCRQIRCQIIDDSEGKTLISAGTDVAPLREAVAKPWTRDAATAVGKRLAELALEKGIKQVRFDRGAYKFHGRVKALADAARAAGLKF